MRPEYLILLALTLTSCIYEVEHSWSGDPPVIQIEADVNLDVVHEVTGDIAVDAAHEVTTKAITILGVGGG